MYGVKEERTLENDNNTTRNHKHRRIFSAILHFILKCRNKMKPKKEEYIRHIKVVRRESLREYQNINDIPHAVHGCNV